MDKLLVKANATADDKWNRLVDALYSEESYDNIVLNHLLTALDFYNEVASGGFEGVLEAYEEQIDEDGINATKEAIAESLNYIGADRAAGIVSSTFPTLKNAMEKYDRALENRELTQVQEEGFVITFNNVMKKYRNLGDGYLHDKIVNFISENDQELFSIE